MAMKQCESKRSNPGAEFIEFAGMALAAVREFEQRDWIVADLGLEPPERRLLAEVLKPSDTRFRKLRRSDGNLTVEDIASVLLSLAVALRDDQPARNLGLLMIGSKLTRCLQRNVVPPALPTIESRRPRATQRVYQFKITLIGFEPEIWRRIQMLDGTLDKLHEQIQTAMGWTNSHLHQFEIQGVLYGDPELLDEDFGDSECVDSTKLFLNEILPLTRQRFVMRYEYDFGDGWEHEVLYEGSSDVDPEVNYPLCLEGKNACPPEDCGGVRGYVELLEALGDPDHEEHDGLWNWVGTGFAPRKFDAKLATRRMKKGLPDWRKMK